jgi:hypothetical protein
MNSGVYVAAGSIVVLVLLFALMMHSADKKLNSLRSKPKRR